MVEQQRYGSSNDRGGLRGAASLSETRIHAARRKVLVDE
jgi:hypothetical protein